MGFLDTVKSIKNVLMGRAAKVYLDTPIVTFGEPFNVTIRAQVQDADIQVNRVYFEIQGREEVEVPDTDVVYEVDGDHQRRTELVRACCSTIEIEIAVAETQELEANQEYEWTATVELPRNAMPTFIGRFCRHYYVARASLDCFGNDPDSGWQDLNIA